jgi:hypothetical protein
MNKLNVPSSKKKINAITVFSFIPNLTIFFQSHFKKYLSAKTKQTYSVVLVRKRIIPTKRSPLVGEVSAKFSG